MTTHHLLRLMRSTGEGAASSGILSRWNTSALQIRTLSVAHMWILVNFAAEGISDFLNKQPNAWFLTANSST